MATLTHEQASTMVATFIANELELAYREFRTHSGAESYDRMINAMHAHQYWWHLVSEGQADNFAYTLAKSTTIGSWLEAILRAANKPTAPGIPDQPPRKPARRAE